MALAVTEAWCGGFFLFVCLSFYIRLLHFGLFFVEKKVLIAKNLELKVAVLSFYCVGFRDWSIAEKNHYKDSSALSRSSSALSSLLLFVAHLLLPFALWLFTLVLSFGACS